MNISENNLTTKEVKKKNHTTCKYITECNTNSTASCQLGPLTLLQRNQKAFKIRKYAAFFQKSLPIQKHRCNKDELLYPNKIGNYSKALPHNDLGEVNITSYEIWLKATTTANPKMFEEIPLGGVAKLANPQGSYSYNLDGVDSHHLGMPIPPDFNSAWIASEMAEDYWLALTRDIPFSKFDSHPLTIQATKELSNFSDFRGPKENDLVTTSTLFRGNTKGDLLGPYISQFLWKNISFGPKEITQKYPSPIPDLDYMTKYNEWLNIQNGKEPESNNKYDSNLRYIRNGRDLGEFVHKDFTYQSCLNACLILLKYGSKALDPNNPYLNSKTQVGFVTFGHAHILDFVARVARLALQTAWFQKFQVHRRLRPEEFGGCVHNNLIGATSYPINPEILNSKVISKIHSKYGSYLLPMAYPEGSPTHPAYPAGHACIAGATVTVLKAFFNEGFILPDTVIATPDGLNLIPYTKEPLTIGGELNKLASNISLGRDTAGVHWRSDGVEGLKLGESVAIELFQNYKNTYNEKFNGFSLTKFDGTGIII